MFTRLLFSLALLSASMYAGADVIYTYTGNNYTQFVDSDPPGGAYSPTDHVTVTFRLANAIAPNATNVTVTPLSFTLTDGRNTLTELNATGSFFGSNFQFSRIRTDASGAIIEWDIFARRGLDPNFMVVGSELDFISSRWLPSAPSPIVDSVAMRVCAQIVANFGCLLSSDEGHALAGASIPNAWIVRASAVPEPATLCLMLLGLFALPGGLRRRR